jgi:hypothetical protein
MKKPTRRGLKWLLIGIGIAAVAWLVWITVQDLSPIDIHSQASRAAAIGYGTLHTASGSSHIIIDEIWKQSASGSPLTVGTAVYTPPLGSGSRHPDGFIVFFTASGLSGSGPLRPGAIVAVYQGRVASEDMSLSDAKALCVAPTSNQAMERTADRPTLHF